MLLFQFSHPTHGQYFVFFDGSHYGISRENRQPHCGYASLAALFKQKGL